MSVESILAFATRKKLRYAVLRPVNKAKIEPGIAKLHDEMSAEDAQAVMNDLIADGFMLRGFVKDGKIKLYDRNGVATGEQMEPGDVMDSIEDFDARVKDGTYAKQDADQPAS